MSQAYEIRKIHHEGKNVLHSSRLVVCSHPKWEERPLLVVVPAAGARPTTQSIADHLESKIAKWWMPDDVVFVEALSYGATGKIQKMELRRRFAGHYGGASTEAAVTIRR